MNKAILFVLLLCVIGATAQTPYPTLDSLASRIRQLQLKANNISYTADDGKTYKISFSDDNFGVLSHNRLAYSSVYKEADGKELLQILENVDLSTATSLEIKEAGKIVVISLRFPPGQLKPTLLENGAVVSSPDVGILDFFCKSDAAADRNSLYNLVAHLTNKMKEEKGLLAEGKADDLAKKWASVSRTTYPQTLASYAGFLNDNPNSLYSREAARILTLEKERKQLEDKRVREAKAMQQQIYDLARVGDQSFRNYNSYYRADTTAGRLLRLYKTSEIGQANSAQLVSFRSELQERYKWNQEFYSKADQIKAFDAQNQKIAALNADYGKKIKAAGSGIFLKACLLALGGIATGVGAYATIAKDEDFSPQYRKNLLMYGGGAFAIGFTWNLAQNSAMRRAGKRVNEASKEAQKMRESIGPVLDMRNQSLGGKLLINEN